MRESESLVLPITLRAIETQPLSRFSRHRNKTTLVAAAKSPEGYVKGGDLCRQDRQMETGSL